MHEYGRAFRGSRYHTTFLSPEVQLADVVVIEQIAGTTVERDATASTTPLTGIWAIGSGSGAVYSTSPMNRVSNWPLRTWFTTIGTPI
jgi:hypothetical protein